MAGRSYVGTSGWNYKDWSGGVFYPERLKASEWLRFYSRHFDTVEINNTFYCLPERHVFDRWYEAVPKGFIFAVKASRFFTHIKRLANPEDHVARFLENAEGLRRKLGALLFQLPPSSNYNPGRLEALLEFLKRQRIIPEVRAALEVRNPSWVCEACFDLLRKYNVTLVLADWPDLRVEGPICADFVFVRRHGPEARYASNYSEAHLRRDAGRIRGWLAEGRDVYVYFNNDVAGFAVRNALRLRELLAG